MLWADSWWVGALSLPQWTQWAGSSHLGWGDEGQGGRDIKSEKKPNERIPPRAPCLCIYQDATSKSSFHMLSPVPNSCHSISSKFPGTAAYLLGKDPNTLGKKSTSEKITNAPGFGFAVVPHCLIYLDPKFPKYCESTAANKAPCRTVFIFLTLETSFQGSMNLLCF